MRTKIYNSISSLLTTTILAIFLCACKEKLVDGGWYHVSVPNKGQTNTAVIKVDSNDTNQTCQAVIIMTAGDVFTHITFFRNDIKV